MAMKELVKLREEVKKRKPKFRRYLGDRIKKISRSGYRKPKGIHNKMRKRIFGKPKMPCSGYGGPKEARHLHPSGYREVIVYNPTDLERVNREEEAVRVASCVGTKKKLEILKKAEELGIKVLNPRIKRRSYLELKAREEKKKKEKEEKAKEEKKVEETKEEEEAEEKKAVKEKAKKAEKKTAEKKGDERKKEVKKKEKVEGKTKKATGSSKAKSKSSSKTTKKSTTKSKK